MTVRVAVGRKTFMCRHITSLLLLAKGQRFSRQLQQGCGLFMDFGREKRVVLDMLFVFYPLDIVWIGTNQKVVAVCQHVRPFVPSLQGPPARFVLELRTGEAEGIRIGDRVTSKLLKKDIS